MCVCLLACMCKYAMWIVVSDSSLKNSRTLWTLQIVSLWNKLSVYVAFGLGVKKMYCWWFAVWSFMQWKNIPCHSDIYCTQKDDQSKSPLIQRKYDPKLLLTLFWPYGSEIEIHFPIKQRKASGKQACTFFHSGALWDKYKTFPRLYLKLRKFTQ